MAVRIKAPKCIVFVFCLQTLTAEFSNENQALGNAMDERDKILGNGAFKVNGGPVPHRLMT